ncbi:MAG TPA: DUF2835 family protein [Chromatiales bacterium]|nr:DUF2835 family protein [Chromatiales bacterium]
MNGSEQRVRFAISISADDYLAYYKGQARQVIVDAEDGRRIQFPASCLQPFIMHDGINGIFVLRFDANNKLVGLEKTGELP